jgi:hypothetical protein
MALLKLTIQSYNRRMAFLKSGTQSYNSRMAFLKSGIGFRAFGMFEPYLSFRTIAKNPTVKSGEFLACGFNSISYFSIRTFNSTGYGSKFSINVSRKSLP